MILSKKLYKSSYTYGFMRGILHSIKYFFYNFRRPVEYYVDVQPQEVYFQLMRDDFENVKCTSSFIF